MAEMFRGNPESVVNQVETVYIRDVYHTVSAILQQPVRLAEDRFEEPGEPLWIGRELEIALRRLGGIPFFVEIRGTREYQGTRMTGQIRQQFFGTSLVNDCPTNRSHYSFQLGKHPPQPSHLGRAGINADVFPR